MKNDKKFKGFQSVYGGIVTKVGNMICTLPTSMIVKCTNFPSDEYKAIYGLEQFSFIVNFRVDVIPKERLGTVTYGTMEDESRKLSSTDVTEIFSAIFMGRSVRRILSDYEKIEWTSVEKLVS